MRLERHAFPRIGKIPISQLEMTDPLGVVKPIDNEGHTATATYVLQNIGDLLLRGSHRANQT